MAKLKENPDYSAIYGAGRRSGETFGRMRAFEGAASLAASWVTRELLGNHIKYDHYRKKSPDELMDAVCAALAHEFNEKAERARKACERNERDRNEREQRRKT